MRFFRCYFNFETESSLISLSEKLSLILFGGAKFIESDDYDTEGFELVGKFIGCKVLLYKSGDTYRLNIQTTPDECLDVNSKEVESQEALLFYMLKVLKDNGINGQGHLFSEQKFSNEYFRNKKK